MCILNLAMYGVALVRAEMPDDMEEECRKAKKSMAGVRKAQASKEWQATHPQEPFKFQELDACMAAVAPIRQLLSSRYEELFLSDR